MRIIAFMNQKGGVGKTTTAVNLGACLAKLGRKTMLIDIDPQANSSIHLGIDIYNTENSIYNVLVSDCPVSKAIRSTGRESFDIVPSNIDLSGAEVELASAVGRETILRDALMDYIQEGGHHDYVLIDCPPSLGLLSLNALTTASEVFIPVQTQFFALQGMGKLLDVIKLVKRRLNPSLELTGILLTMFDKRTNLAHEVVEEVRRYFKEKVFASMIRSNIRIAEAPGHGKTIIEYDPHSSGARDYMALAREVADEEAETEPMTWPPPGLGEEARRAEEKLRRLLQEERAQQEQKEWPQPPAQTTEPAAPESAAPPPAPEDPQQETPKQNFKEQVETEITEIKEIIELASGQGYMKLTTEEVTYPAPHRSSPPAIRYYSVSQFEAVETTDSQQETAQEPPEEEPDQ